MKRILVFLMMFLTIIFVTVGCSSDKMPEETAEGFTEELYRSVEIMPLESRDLSENYRVYGKVVPSDELTLGIQGGVVADLLVSEGDYVTAGDVIYKIDIEDAKESFAKQKETAYYNVTSSKNAYDDAVISYEKTVILFNEGAVSQSELDKRKSFMENAEINFNKASVNYKAVKDIEKTALMDSELVSPIDGVVSSIKVSEGERASSKDIVITTESVTVKTLVSGRVSREIGRGDQVDVTFEDNRYSGVIQSINPNGLNNTDSFPVTITLSEETILKSGFDVDVNFSINNIENQIMIPKKSVLTDESGDYVYLYEDKVVRKTHITQGITTNGQVQAFGIVEGAYLVVSGQSFVQDGEIVEIE